MYSKRVNAKIKYFLYRLNQQIKFSKVSLTTTMKLFLPRLISIKITIKPLMKVKSNTLNERVMGDKRVS